MIKSILILLKLKIKIFRIILEDFVEEVRRVEKKLRKDEFCKINHPMGRLNLIKIELN